MHGNQMHNVIGDVRAHSQGVGPTVYMKIKKDHELVQSVLIGVCIIFFQNKSLKMKLLSGNKLCCIHSQEVMAVSPSSWNEETNNNQICRLRNRAGQLKH